MTRRRFELTDLEWDVIEPLLPNKVRGVHRVDDRRVINGILWRFRTGSPWADIPERYGPYTTCYNRFVRWREAGVWDRLLASVSAAFDGELVMIDSSSIRVHQLGAPDRGPRAGSGRRRQPRRGDGRDPRASQSVLRLSGSALDQCRVAPRPSDRHGLEARGLLSSRRRRGVERGSSLEAACHRPRARSGRAGRCAPGSSDRAGG